MTAAVKRIKEKVMKLPALTLPTGKGKLIIETDASAHTWGGVLLEAIDQKEYICGYGSGSFKKAELNYPSSHKEILAVKKTVQHFILFLKPVKFIIRTDLKIMPRMLKNENVMAENNSRILKWFIWLSNFDYEIVYKPGYLNCLADMLTRESVEELKALQPALNMFDPGESSFGPARRRMRRELESEEEAAKKPKTHEELLQKEGLFILP